MSRFQKKDECAVNGLIERGCSFEGKLTFDGTVQINGDFRGEILSDGTLIVGPDARIYARVQIDTIVIEGHVEGIIDAKQKIELRKGATLIGDVQVPSLVMQEGAVFHGKSQMLQDRDQRADEGQSLHEGETYMAESGEDSLMM